MRIEKRTEGTQGAVCEVMQFAIPDGETAPAPTRKSRTIELFGDSITAGYGNMTENGQSGFRLEEEDYAHGFPALTAQALDAFATVLGWSGVGMYQDLSGGKAIVFSKGLFRRTLAHYYGSLSIAGIKG